MNREFLDYLEDILDAMDKAELLVTGITYDEFAADFRINYAVVGAGDHRRSCQAPPHESARAVSDCPVARHGGDARSHRPRL